MIAEIPKSEFQERARRVQAELAKRGLDALLTFGNEAEPAFVRYLCDYWPAFETAGVLVPVEGDPLLLIGPESLAFAESRSKIDKIRQILEYRESAEPEYPGKALDTFASVFDEVSGGKGVKRLGMVGYPVTTVPVYEGVRQAMAGGEIVRADDILVELRKVKSENELALLRRAFRISEQALEAVLNNIQPGMAEVQVVGIAQEALYRLGAEYEGHPLYVLSGRNSANAIGRPTHKRRDHPTQHWRPGGRLLLQRWATNCSGPHVGRSARVSADGVGCRQQNHRNNARWGACAGGSPDRRGVHQGPWLWGLHPIRPVPRAGADGM
jgi:Xaa-Pro aminopeptidase